MSKKEKKSRGGSQIPPSKNTELKVSARPSTPADSKKSSISEAEPKKPSIEKTAIPAVTNPINKKVFIEAVSTDSETQEPKEGVAQVDSSPIGAAVKGATLNGKVTNREKARQERRRRRRKQGRRSRRKSIAPPDSEDSETENVAAEAKTSDDDDDSEEDDVSPTERRTRRSTLPQAGRKRDRVKLVDASTNTPPASMTGLVSSEATAAKSVQTSTKATQTGDVIITPRVAKGSRAQRSPKRADKKTTQEKSSPAARRPKPRIAMSDTTVVTTELRAPKATISERFYEETISTKDDSTDDPSSFSSDFLSEDAFTFSRPANVLTRRPRKSGKSKYARSTFEPRQAYSTDPAIAEGAITSESLEDMNRLCSYLPTTRGTDYVGAVEMRDPRYLKSDDNANIEEYYKEVREEFVEASSNDSEGEQANRVGRDTTVIERYNFIDTPEYAGGLPRQSGAFDDPQTSWQPSMGGTRGQSAVSSSWNFPSRVDVEAPTTRYAFQVAETTAQRLAQPPRNMWPGSQGAAQSTSVNPVFQYCRTNAAETCSSEPCVSVPADDTLMGTSSASTPAVRQNASFQHYGASASSFMNRYPVNAEPCVIHKAMLQGGQMLPLAMPPLVRFPTAVHSTCSFPSACHSWMPSSHPSQFCQFPQQGTHCCCSSVLRGIASCLGCRPCPANPVHQRQITCRPEERSRSRPSAETCKAIEDERMGSVGRHGRQDQRGVPPAGHPKHPDAGKMPHRQKSRAPRKAFPKKQRSAAETSSSGALRQKNGSKERSSSKQSVTSASPPLTGSPSRQLHGSKQEIRVARAKQPGRMSPRKSYERAATSSSSRRQLRDHADQTKAPCSSTESRPGRSPLPPEDLQ